MLERFVVLTRHEEELPFEGACQGPCGIQRPRTSYLHEGFFVPAEIRHRVGEREMGLRGWLKIKGPPEQLFGPSEIPVVIERNCAVSREGVRVLRLELQGAVRRRFRCRKRVDRPLIARDRKRPQRHGKPRPCVRKPVVSTERGPKVLDRLLQIAAIRPTDVRPAVEIRLVRRRIGGPGAGEPALEVARQMGRDCLNDTSGDRVLNRDAVVAVEGILPDDIVAENRQ
jgi:hypothetical protein